MAMVQREGFEVLEVAALVLLQPCARVQILGFRV
jgi:hypothetical protein